VLLAACGSPATRPVERDAAVTAPQPAGAARRGGYYQDDGPGDNPPENLAAIPDAVPRAEPLHRFANKPYSALGRDYVPMKEHQPYKARGVASWYGRKFHGQKTSSGEPYDMYAMTAAHPTLPIPSYARVTNLENGRSVVVRVNDRGPFLHDRLIDLSYVAAYRLGYAAKGSARVDVEAVRPGDTGLAAMGAVPAGPATVASDPLAELAAAPGSEARGTFLQLGAFGSAENAESFRARLAQQLAWLAASLHVHSKDGMYRLHAGPYRDAEEAGRAAERIREALDFKPLVVQRQAGH
jgi:rare lipoprotein A